MNVRAIVLAVVVIALAGAGWRLMAGSMERSSAPVGPTISATSLPEQAPPPLPRIDVSVPSAAPQTPASSGIDCTRGVACPIIYAPSKGR